MPFEFIGAPYIDPDKLCAVMQKMKLPGVHFRPIFFQPTYQKCKDEVCGGTQVHVTDARRYNSFKAGIRLLGAIHDLYPTQFKWKQPPYEYEHEKMPIDLIAGTARLRQAVEGGTLARFEAEATQELAQFRTVRKKFLLYGKKR